MLKNVCPKCGHKFIESDFITRNQIEMVKNSQISIKI